MRLPTSCHDIVVPAQVAAHHPIGMALPPGSFHPIWAMTDTQPPPMVGTADGRDPEGRMLIVVRHGDAGVKGSFDGPDRLRPLSPVGHHQAEGLVIRLEDYPVERVLSSPTVRCRQTVAPLAGDRLLGVEPVAALGVDAGPFQVRSIFWDPRLRNTVLCTHGETISQLFTQLAMDGLEVEEALRWPKGSTWLIWHAEPHVRARYLPPLAFDPVHAS
jgi:8-oxo-dGTP diphosphatase